MSSATFDLSGRVAIVTGASEGMGLASAQLFAASGARLVVTARTKDKIEAVAEDLNSRHGHCGTVAVAVAGDLGDKAHLRSLVETAVECFGALTTLLCSPAIRPWLGSSIDTPDDVFDEQLLYVLKSRFWLSSMAIPHMIAAGTGSLIYIGSGSVFEATGERSVNCIARAGEWQMMKNFAAEFGKYNVRANTIAPGMVESSGSRTLFESEEGARRIASLPLRRGGRTDEIANAAAFLASDASSFTTGAVIPVDGGRLLHAVDSMLLKSEGRET
ncbi:SDR family oxidoreductase [Croceicoccus sp. BE223]|uniref:SDR family NAD(P)-dependent oxidoreductase n=1 Tax=Croceicoccus sp. BE223 TaxID=2817716 RepID=UPI002857722F|nr:SDR family oxidoreductase [Croceicoccus sp. BE223]MDR7103672.1 NAD(P)-dependent dehydrogenase (short-subunit alcohol dehydrogenase family) [Croceicoccus sp. BE223]